MRRRLAGVAHVSISQREQTVAIAFEPDTYTFSAAAFRSAIAEAEVEVITIDARVCGIVDEQQVLRARSVEQPRLVRLRAAQVPVGSSICVGGRLDDRVDPYGLNVETSP